MSDKPIPHPATFVDTLRLERIRGYAVHEARTPDKPVRVLAPSQTIGPFYPQALIAPGDDAPADVAPVRSRAKTRPQSSGGPALGMETR